MNKSDKVGGHEKGGQIWNQAIMEGANMGVPVSTVAVIKFLNLICIT